jgi:hypothetical protein
MKKKDWQEAAPDLLKALQILADWPLGKKSVAESLCDARRFARETISKVEEEESLNAQ